MTGERSEAQIPAMQSRRAFLQTLAGAALVACGSRGVERAVTPRSNALRLHYLPTYTGSAHAFETTRKATWVADSLAATPIPGVSLTSHAPVDVRLLMRVHDPKYVTAVKTGIPIELAQSQGFDWDPGLWDMVCASNGGAVAAALAALEDKVSGALASGLHHARRESGRGFCTFNGLALAVRALQDKGVERVLVLDLDAHCGGGTHALVGDDPSVHHADIAVDGFDRYTPARGNTLELVTNPAEYLPTLDARLDALGRERFDICLYNAGMDPHEHCAIGGLTGIDHTTLVARERRVFEWCASRDLPVAFVLAGGYLSSKLTREGLVDLHRATLTAAAAIRT